MARTWRLAVLFFAAGALALVVPGAAATSARAPAARQAERPGPLNLVVIVTDDQAHWSIGAYGNTDSRTPHMNRLAREGARFAAAFTPTPVCSPSRGTFLTGRYGTELGVTDWISPAEADAGAGMDAAIPTWPEVLQRAGYRTALFGKWHLGSRPALHPTKRGFHRFAGFLAGGNRPIDGRLEIDGADRDVPGVLADALTTEAIRFIAEQDGRPFAVNLHFREPHLPYTPVAEADAAPFALLDPAVPAFPGLDVAQVKQWTRDYYASIHSVDRNLGRLLAALDDRGLADRTIVLFTSDHGYNIGHHGLHAKGNGFWIVGGVRGPHVPNMFEESIRVPLLVRGPVVARPGIVIDELVSAEDTFASVLGMLGVREPPASRHHGRDFAPVLRGEKPAWRDAVFGQYDMHHYTIAHMRMIRTARWKLVRYHGSTGQDRLFDLADDPGETTNRFNRAETRTVQAALQQRLDDWMRTTGDPLAPGAAPSGSPGGAAVRPHLK